LLDDKMIRIHTSDWWIRIREAQKHVDPIRNTGWVWLELFFLFLLGVSLVKPQRVRGNFLLTKSSQ
jgi:hypothetical protein